MIPVFRIPVRALAEFCLRSGDLGYGYTFDTLDFQEGIRAHQALQDSRGEQYQAEVPVSREVSTKAYKLIVSGRIDGVYSSEDRICLEEIKATAIQLNDISEENPVHWAQVKTYGALYARQHKQDNLELQVTYTHPASGECKTTTRMFAASDLERDFSQLIAFYRTWLERRLAYRKQRDIGLRDLQFPFPHFRAGQEELMGDVQQTIDDSSHLLAEAPTGLGKTLSVLYPAVISLSQGKLDKVFFLTARTPGIIAAETALRMLKKKPQPLKWVSLTAKDKICFNPGTACTGAACEFARGFYDKLNGVLEACWDESEFPRGVIEDLGHQHRICPFELSLELALFADVIVCDYNYAFDPRVYLRRFFLQKSLLDPGDRYFFIVDEAHNLVDRAREMYSATLVKRDFLNMKKTLRDPAPAVAETAGAVNTWLVNTRRELEFSGATGAQQESPEEIIPLLQDFTAVAEDFMRGSPDPELVDSVLDLYFPVLRFMRTLERYDERYATFFSKGPDGFSVRLYCLDPSGDLQTYLKNARAAVFLSATLSPAPYVLRMLGCGASAAAISLPSPFPAEHLCVLHLPGLSVRFRHRRDTASRVADACRRFADCRKGNYLLYFPSYAFMDLIYGELTSTESDWHIFRQEPGMSEDGRTQFLEQFRAGNDTGQIGMAVMGGIFGESVDLVGERLTGVAIVGVGLPAITMERELIKHYFDPEGLGFDYAYRYPGMIRVLQAAGRVIRTDEDRGVVLLIDDRFALPAWSGLMPPSWQIRNVADAEMLQAELTAFWNG